MQLYISRLRDPWGKINTQASPGPTGLQAMGGKNGSLPAQKICGSHNAIYKAVME